ncbi:MAG TPA: hypothetical protein VIR30_02715 [Nocardioides sp.]
MRENAAAKGRRYLTEGRVVITHASAGRVDASIRGDGTIHLATYRHGTWSCTCEVRTDRCSHLVALRLVTAPELPRTQP